MEKESSAAAARRACKRAKITPPLRFHEARHSYASALAQGGADLLTISKLLGNADTRITSRPLCRDAAVYEFLRQPGTGGRWRHLGAAARKKFPDFEVHGIVASLCAERIGAVRRSSHGGALIVYAVWLIGNVALDWLGAPFPK